MLNFFERLSLDIKYLFKTFDKQFEQQFFHVIQRNQLFYSMFDQIFT